MEAQLPSAMRDMSVFRQVPDYQELYSDDGSGASVIIELLSREAAVSDADCARFYYDGLARANESAGTTILGKAALTESDIPQLLRTPADPRGRACAYGGLITGIQRISKFRNEMGKENDVFVGLCVLRFPSPIATDVLVSLSAPVRVAEGSSEARVVERLYTEEERLETLRTAVGTLRVNDWGLFVPE